MFRFHSLRNDTASPRRRAIAALGALGLAAAALAGLGSTASAATATPPAPAFIAPAPGSTVSVGSPMFVGTGQPGATVTVTYTASSTCVKGQVCPVVPVVQLCTVQVQNSGAWSCKSMWYIFSAGTFTVQAVQSAAPGIVSAPGSVTFSVAAAPKPNPPVIVWHAINGALTTHNPPFSGTGAAGATVTVWEGTSSLCTATVAADSSWQCTSQVSLGDGPHTVFATQANAGVSSDSSNQVSFSIDTTGPAAPVISYPTNGLVVDDSSPSIQGTGNPGSQVWVNVDNIGTVCLVTVDPTGAWSCPSGTLTQPLPNGGFTSTLGAFTFSAGTHTLTVLATDVGGNQSASTSVTFTVGSAVDVTAPTAPVFTAPKQGATVTTTTPVFSGTGEPGASVRVYTQTSPVCQPGRVCSTAIRQTQLCTATVAADGTWACTTSSALSTGSATAYATQTDAAGNTSQPASVTFTVRSSGYCYANVWSVWPGMSGLRWITSC